MLWIYRLAFVASQQGLCVTQAGKQAVDMHPLVDVQKHVIQQCVWGVAELHHPDASW